eukprot:852555-Prymnesium_polylepis.1
MINYAQERSAGKHCSVLQSVCCDLGSAAGAGGDCSERAENPQTEVSDSISSTMSPYQSIHIS